MSPEARPPASRLETRIPSSSSPTSPLDLNRPGTTRFACASAGVVVLVHLLLWGWIAWKEQLPFGELLTHWDASHYTNIVRSGYEDPILLAFYPAYPSCVRALGALSGGAWEPYWVGAIFSTLLFFGFVVLCARLAHREALPTGLTPRTRLGWLFFLLSPASYVFHSHHTESLFLLLSFTAFAFQGTRRPGRGGLAGALCALTRNQGVLVVATGALLAAGSEPPARRVRSFLLAAGLGALGLVAFFSFEYLVSGNPFAFVISARHWTHASNVKEVLRTLVFGNRWQRTDPNNLIRYAAWWVCFGGAVLLARRQLPLGLYALLSLGMQLAQGELVNTFRFVAPVFPLLFFLGDACARWPRWAQGLVLVLLAVLNAHTARSYGLGVWAY